MSNSLTYHLEMVQLVVERLHPRRAFSFAFACVERQWPIYERSSLGKSWSPAGLRSSIDQAWQQLIEKQKMPGYLIDRCRRSIPPDDIVNDSEAAAARLISHSAIDLLVALQEDESEFCHLPAVRNFDLLEMLGKEPDSPDDLKTLFDREIKKQKDDLVTMRVSSRPEQISAIRAAASGSSLYGDLWFPS